MLPEGPAITLQDNQVHFVPGDEVKGTVVHHSRYPEPKASLLLKFSGVATIWSGKKREKVLTEVVLFTERKSWPCQEHQIVNGTQSWKFEFRFPAMTSTQHSTSKLTLGRRFVQKQAKASCTRHNLPPSTTGEFWTKSGMHVGYSVEYGLEATLERGRRYAPARSSRIVWLRSSLDTPGWMTSAMPPHLVSPFSKIMRQATAHLRPAVLKYGPRIQLHRDSFALAGRPVRVRIALASDDGKKVLAADPDKPVHLKAINVTITQTKQALVPQVKHSHKSVLVRTSVDWTLEKNEIKDTMLTIQPLDLASIFGEELQCFGLTTSVECSNIEISQRILVSARVSYKDLEYAVSLEQSLKVMPAPPLRPRPSVVDISTTMTSKTELAIPDLRQDSLAPFSVPGRQFPDLPKCDIPKILVNGEAPPSASQEGDEDGIIRIDWQNVHDMRQQQENLKKRQLSTSLSDNVRDGDNLGRFAKEHQQLAAHPVVGKGKEPAFTQDWDPQEIWKKNSDEQVAEALEICRRRSSVVTASSLAP